jgi:hypothetical protein
MLCNRAIAAQHKALVTEAQALMDDEFWASAAVHAAKLDANVLLC